MYNGQATVKSGAQDTSSGQTCRRIECFVRTCELLDIQEIFGYAFGDDLWVLIKGDVSVQQLELVQQQFGWKSKGAFVDTPEESDFLACTFVQMRNGDYAMVPLIGRMLAKLFWTWRLIPKRQRSSYIHQVAEAFVLVYQGFEFMEIWLSKHMFAVDKKIVLPDRLISYGKHASTPLWSDLLFKRYGLGYPPHDLVNLLKNTPPGRIMIIDHPWSKAIMQYDLADPAERPHTKHTANC